MVESNSAQSMAIVHTLRMARALGIPMRSLLVLLALQLGGIIFEGIGIGMMLPVFEFVKAEGNLEVLTGESALWRRLVAGYAAIGLPVTLSTLLATSLAAIALRQAFAYVRDVRSARFQHRQVRRLSIRGVDAYLHAQMAHVDGERLGEIVNDLTEQVVRTLSGVMALLGMASNAVLLAGYALFLAVLSPAMTAMALVALGLASFALRFLFKRTRSIGIKVTAAYKDHAAFLIERLRSLRLIRLSHAEAPEIAMLRRLSGDLEGKQYALRRARAQTEVAFEPVMIVVAFVLLYVGVTQFALTLEKVGLFLLIVLRQLPVVKAFIGSYQILLASLASIEAVDRRLRSLEAAREVRSGSQTFSRLERGVEFRDVSFHYRGSELSPALRHVTLSIPARRITALVGPSGAGKSTLVDLLVRIREPQEGDILLDGVPHTAFDLQSLRAGVAFLPQSPQLFNVSVADHIAYGRPQASTPEIEAAARLAGAHDFIRSLPMGYGTLVGEAGTRLSGGQRQRLDLARVLIKRAPVLILDEPTSNLDADAEQAFREALMRLRAEATATVIVIAHRLSTVASADQIVVLQNGAVVARGGHEELVRQGGWYASAFEKQRLDGISGRQGALAVD